MNVVKFLKTTALMLMMLLCSLAASAQTIVSHIVDRGETLESIAAKYNVTKEAIIKLNPDAAQFVYVGMELKLPEIKKVQTNEGNPQIVSSSPVVYSEEEGNSVKSTSLKSNEADGFYGLMVHGCLEDEAYKYGANVEFEGAGIINNGFGFDFSIGWGVLWNPKFDLTNCCFTLGPCYGTKLSPTVELYAPIKILSVWTMDDEDKWHGQWGCRINPTVLIGGKTKFAVGAFVDMMKVTSFGLTLGLAFRID